MARVTSPTLDFHRSLGAWFQQHQRTMPWRSDRDPYKIWVSEVMLQQTTVAAVRPFFERFIDTFPTVRDLANADEQSVLKLWSGLGYYRRARHLHQAAQQLVEQFGDDLPDDPVVWAKLPGVGRYILGAVLSQAFDRRLPIVEANTLRVLCRLFGYSEDPRTTAGQKWLWQAAETVLPQSKIGEFNQSMMELGSLVCTPKQPKCDVCPVAQWCKAKELGLQSTIPIAKLRKEKVAVRELALVIEHRGKLLFARRSATAKRWASMWEFPHGEWPTDETLDVAATRLAKELTDLSIEVDRELMTIKHGVTHYAITMHCLKVKKISGRLRSSMYDKFDWLHPQELTDYPVSSPQRKLIEALILKHAAQLCVE